MVISSVSCRVLPLLAACMAPLAFGQVEDEVTRPVLTALLTAPENAWVLRHLCVPTDLLGSYGYTNAEFADAYFAMNRDIWARADMARKRGDKEEWTNALAPILHSVIDAYQPGRLARDESGAITGFRACEEFGGLKGIVHDEHAGDNADRAKERVMAAVKAARGNGNGSDQTGGAAGDNAVYYMAQVVRAWTGSRPFEEIEAILRSGPMRLSSQTAATALPQMLNRPAPNEAAALANMSSSDSLSVTEIDGKFRLRGSASKLAITFPRGAFARDQLSLGPRYFHFSDATRGITLSGWFEAAASYPGIDRLWNGETEMWQKKGLPSAQNAARSRYENWEVITYDVPLPAGSDTHIKAEWVQSDTWIDIHISVGNSQPIEKSRAVAMEVLKSLQVMELQQLAQPPGR